MDRSSTKTSHIRSLRKTSNNTPVQAPLYPSDGRYRSDNFEGIAVLVETDSGELNRVCAGTPFKPVGNQVWVEFMTMPSCEGLAPYSGGGVIIPARFKDRTGGYYAFCYVDTDDSLALGREAYGYPKKFAKMDYQRTGRAVTARFVRPDFELKLSFVFDNTFEKLPAVPRYPHLLYQVLPCASSNEPLIRRVVARDTSKLSSAVSVYGDGAMEVISKHPGNEVGWLQNAKVIGGVYASGSFQGSLAEVLETEFVHPELTSACPASALLRQTS